MMCPTGLVTNTKSTDIAALELRHRAWSQMTCFEGALAKTEPKTVP